MVARSEIMYGCYDTYSYRLWSLANVWNTCQHPALPNGTTKEEEFSAMQEYSIKCPQCQKGCQTFQALKEHIEISHSELSSLSSSDADSLCISNAISTTPPLASNGGQFGCLHCTTSFSSKELLDKHELLHSPNAQVSCKICNKSFANVYRLQRHMISHDESAVLRKFKCTECDKAFKFKHHLKEHVRIHSGEKPFECGNCGKRFSHSGSYSSHMTSKKCLIINLKLGKPRSSSNNNKLDKTFPQTKTPKRLGVSVTNSTTPNSNSNSYLPLPPKYPEPEAVPFLHSPVDTSPVGTPLFLTSPSFLNTAQSFSRYPHIPSLGHIIEQLRYQQEHCSSPLKPYALEHKTDIKQEKNHNEYENMSENQENNDNSNRSVCGDLVIDDDEDIEKKSEGNEKIESPNRNGGGDLEAVKRILETVNVTVTKELLTNNMHKAFTESYNDDCRSIVSNHSPKQNTLCICKTSFESSIQLDDHECEDVRSEGLAAKLEGVFSSKSGDKSNGAVSGSEEQDYEKIIYDPNDETDAESNHNNDHSPDDDKKIRVRSLISDHQLRILKNHYKLNPRPKREDLEKIANEIGFPVRVVQVWFQNTRARDRREGKLIQVPLFSVPIFPHHSSSSNLSGKFHPAHDENSEQPLDLSIKKESLSNESSPTSSPGRPASTNHYFEPNFELINLSTKRPTSPTPYMHYKSQHQNSNSTEFPDSPSPLEFNTNKLAQIFTQPPYNFGLGGSVPMDRLMQLSLDIPNLSFLNANKLYQANSEKKDSSEGIRQGPNDMSEEDLSTKISSFLLKGPGNPILNSQDQEVEGQFCCNQCDKTFSKQSSLARHKYEHSGQRPHKCDECPKAFKHKHHLTEHKRLHSGEKPFQCSKCLKRFSHSGSYSQHMNHRYSYCKPYRE